MIFWSCIEILIATNIVEKFLTSLVCEMTWKIIQSYFYFCDWIYLETKIIVQFLEVFIASASGGNNYIFAADSAEELAETLRVRGCIVDPVMIKAVDQNGKHFGGYKIYSQKLSLGSRDVNLFTKLPFSKCVEMEELRHLDMLIRTATIANDLDRLAELQVLHFYFYISHPLDINNLWKWSLVQN